MRVIINTVFMDGVERVFEIVDVIGNSRIMMIGRRRRNIRVVGKCRIIIGLEGIITGDVDIDTWRISHKYF